MTKKAFAALLLLALGLTAISFGCAEEPTFPPRRDGGSTGGRDSATCDTSGLCF